ncbi:MAG: DUF4143 domain-containing protein [Pseudomonadota bacterium]
MPEWFLKQSLVKQGLEPEMYFFRETKGNKVDLLIARGRELIPIEIKSAETYSPDFMKGINYVKKISGHEGKSFVVYAGERQQQIEKTLLCNFAEAGFSVMSVLGGKQRARKGEIEPSPLTKKQKPPQRLR